MNRSTNSYAWKLAKLAKSILFLANTSDARTSGIFETLRAWSVGQTKWNMIMKIRINLVLKFIILISLFVSIVFNTCRLQFEIEIRSPSQTFLERPVHNLVGLVIPRFYWIKYYVAASKAVGPGGFLQSGFSVTSLGNECVYPPDKESGLH